MRIAVVKESEPGEARVALVPESVKRLVGKQHTVVIQQGAGDGALFSDEEYKAAGAEIVSDPRSDADLVLCVQGSALGDVRQLKEGASVIGMLAPFTSKTLIEGLAQRKTTAMAAELVPRTTLAQMMDVLSSQTTIAGYRAVILAAEAAPRLFPMLMTAAGTIAPAKVLIIGAGVAGLQAIATARRLGAVVEAFDARKLVKEQVESLGAKFVMVDSSEDAQTKSGYAAELSEDYKQKQAALLADHCAKSDVVITTAQIPGKKAPILITKTMVERMRRGSVIVDLAAEQGGNCELTQAAKTIKSASGVVIIGAHNLPSQAPIHASQMYSRNMEKLIAHIAKKGAIELDLNEEITKGIVVTHAGAIVNEKVKEAIK
jgi:NAD(P) transhydrogenase subunit alpha